MRAVIFANGTPPPPALARHIAQKADLVICADGGSRVAIALDVRPDCVIGDMDSLDEETMATLRGWGVEILVYPVRKDETDLELALLYAAEAGAASITILGATGGRPDQMLANVMLLALPQLRGISTQILDEDNEIQLIRGEDTIAGEAGDVVSLLPLGGDAVGVETEGLEYALAGSTLALGAARGISNVMTGPLARVKIASGLLLVVRLIKHPKT